MIAQFFAAVSVAGCTASGQDMGRFASEPIAAGGIVLAPRLLGSFFGVTPMNQSIVASFSFALLVAIALLVREVRINKLPWLQGVFL